MIRGLNDCVDQMHPKIVKCPTYQGNNLKNSKVIFRCPKKIVTLVRFNFSNYSNVGSSEFLKFPHYKQLPVHAINNIISIIISWVTHNIINSSQSQCRTNGLVQVPEDIPIKTQQGYF